MKAFLLTLGICLSGACGVALALKDQPSTPRVFRQPALVQSLGHLTASWYGKWHHGRLMANRKPFDMFAVTAAHKTLPLGTTIRITNPKNGTSVIAEITDRGPYIPGRSLDLSYEAARRLDMIKEGVVRLKIDVVTKGD